MHNNFEIKWNGSSGTLQQRVSSALRYYYYDYSYSCIGDMCLWVMYACSFFLSCIVGILWLWLWLWLTDPSHKLHIMNNILALSNTELNGLNDKGKWILLKRSNILLFLAKLSITL